MKRTLQIKAAMMVAVTAMAVAAASVTVDNTSNEYSTVGTPELVIVPEASIDVANSLDMMGTIAASCKFTDPGGTIEISPAIGFTVNTANAYWTTVNTAEIVATVTSSARAPNDQAAWTTVNYNATSSTANKTIIQATALNPILPMETAPTFAGAATISPGNAFCCTG